MADWCLQLIGDTTELDWHSFPVLVYTQMAFAYTCLKAFSFTRRWRFVSLAGYAALVGWVAVPKNATGCRSYVAINRGTAGLSPMVDLAALRAVTATIPKDAKLSVTSDLEIFVAARRRLLWPESSSFAEYVVINRRADGENKARADDFMRTFPADDLAARYFYNNVNVVLRGFDYDTALIAYMDRLKAEGAVTLLKSEGRLELYRLHNTLPFSLH